MFLGESNGIGEYKFDYSKEGVFVGKIDLESMLDESGFGATTEIGGFVMKKIPEVSLAPETFWISIFTSSVSV